MCKNELISIIVPIYRVEPYLDECVQSLLAQTYKHIEIILVDDGSPDRCPEICDQWARKDPRIHVIHKLNGGLSDARNVGIDNANGQYIGFVDSDDFVSPDMYLTLLNGFKKTSHVGITACNIQGYRNGKTESFNEQWQLSTVRITASDKFANIMESGIAAHTAWNKLYRSEVAKSAKFRCGRNNEDMLYMFDLRHYMREKQLCFVEIPQSLYYYRRREDSICTNTATPLAIHKIQNIHDMYDECQETEKELKETLKKQYVWAIFVFLEKMLKNQSLKKQYFTKYQSKLTRFPTSYLVRNFGWKNAFWIYLTVHFPTIRQFYNRIKNGN